MVKIDKKQYDHTLDRMVQFYREDYATIESLLAENESLKAQLNTRADGWVSVDERLPDTHGTYLCIIAYDYYDIVDFDLVNGAWLDDEEDGGYYSLVITHWMPLPSQPADK